MHTTRTLASIPLLLSVLIGCSLTDTDQIRAPRAHTASRATFVNKVWKVAESSSVDPGHLYVFLSEGTLVMASAHGKPAFGTWRYDGGALTMVEEGIPYKIDILKLSENDFWIRSNNPGEPVEIRLVRADESMPAVATPVSATSMRFRALDSRSGRLALASGELRFVACGETGNGIPLEDLASGEGKALVRELGANEKGITVLVRLDGTRLLEIRYAGPEGPSCDRLPPEGEAEAHGNEPFWSLRVEGSGALFRTPEAIEGMRYRDGKWSRPGATQWRYEARREPAEGTDSLSLELTEERCADGMSGARYPYRAVLVRDGNRLNGCALEGRQAPRPQN